VDGKAQVSRRRVQSVGFSANPWQQQDSGQTREN
jgi:hypothetical protein